MAAVADWKRHGQPFYYIRQALLLMVLMLIKNTGFIWVAFGLLFAIAKNPPVYPATLLSSKWYLYNKKTKRSNNTYKLRGLKSTAIVFHR